jgi:hypothetical protein
MFCFISGSGHKEASRTISLSPRDAERLLLHLGAFTEAVRVDDQAITGLQWNFDRRFL